MPTLNFTVRDKIITRNPENEHYVNGNSDYLIRLDLDQEWSEFAALTARLRWIEGSECLNRDILFTGTDFEFPVMYNVKYVEIGIFAGNKHTTTPAIIVCDGCILDGNPIEHDPDPDIYAQLLDAIQSGLIAGRSPYIGENGNWYQWSESNHQYVDTGIASVRKPNWYMYPGGTRKSVGTRFTVMVEDLIPPLVPDVGDYIVSPEVCSVARVHERGIGHILPGSSTITYTSVNATVSAAYEGTPGMYICEEPCPVSPQDGTIATANVDITSLTPFLANGPYIDERIYFAHDGIVAKIVGVQKASNYVVIEYDYTLKGENGEKGEKGEKGDNGDRGEPGAVGRPGLYTTNVAIPVTGNFTNIPLSEVVPNVVPIYGEYILSTNTKCVARIVDVKSTYIIASFSFSIVGPQGIQGETGPQGPQGDDYVLTSADKQEIAGIVAEEDFYTRDETDALLAEKANQNGTYPDLITGAANQLISSVGVVDKVPYSFRTSGGSASIGRWLTDKVVGGSIVWNQRKNVVSGTTTAPSFTVYNTTNTAKSNTNTYTRATVKVNSPGYRGGMYVNYANSGSHRFLIKYKAMSNKNVTVGINYGGTTQYLTTTLVAGEWAERWGILTMASAETRMWFVYTTALEVDDYVDWSEIMVFDLTKMFGSEIAEYLYSLRNEAGNPAVVWFRNLFPKPFYKYTAGELVSVCANAHITRGFNAYNHETQNAKLVGNNKYQITGAYTSLSYSTGETITPDENGEFTPSSSGVLSVTGGDSSTTCVHLVWNGSRNGEYAPYVEHDYSLSPIELRGILKLDSGNNLYFDGDTYAHDGTITRNYEYRTYQSGDESLPDAITDGTYTVVKLLVPTTETANSFEDPQIVDDFGTEEYIDALATAETNPRDVAIPVGHETLYQANLRDKVQNLPDNANADGDYIVRQNGSKQNLVPIHSVDDLFPESEKMVEIPCIIGSNVSLSSSGYLSFSTSSARARTEFFSLPSPYKYMLIEATPGYVYNLFKVDDSSYTSNIPATNINSWHTHGRILAVDNNARYIIQIAARDTTSDVADGVKIIVHLYMDPPMQEFAPMYSHQKRAQADTLIKNVANYKQIQGSAIDDNGVIFISMPNERGNVCIIMLFDTKTNSIIKKETYSQTEGAPIFGHMNDVAFRDGYWYVPYYNADSVPHNEVFKIAQDLSSYETVSFKKDGEDLSFSCWRFCYDKNADKFYASYHNDYTFAIFDSDLNYEGEISLSSSTTLSGTSKTYMQGCETDGTYLYCCNTRHDFTAQYITVNRLDTGELLGSITVDLGYNNVTGTGDELESLSYDWTTGMMYITYYVKVEGSNRGYCVQRVNLLSQPNIAKIQYPVSAIAGLQLEISQKQDKPAIVTSGTAITLADNTEYKLSGVTSLDISFPSSGSYSCWITITTDATTAPTISFPASALFVGTKPSFGVGEIWKIFVEDGVIIAGKAVSAS